MVTRAAGDARNDRIVAAGAGPARLGALGAALVPGLLAGAHLAALLFFLNPTLDFSPASFLRGIAAYGGLLGAASLLLLAPLAWLRPVRAARLLPWTLTAALLGAAVVYWTHASRFAFYLPPGINARLIKAAMGLSAAALAAFYTALLHSIHGRPYGWRSRVLLATLAALSVYLLAERREAAGSRPPPGPLPSAVVVEPRPSLWVIGLDGATLDAILPLAKQGRLPFFGRLLQDGSYGRLETLTPARDPALGTTLATGKLPYKHGLVAERVYPAPVLAPGGVLELTPDGLGFRTWGTFGQLPVRTDARRRRAAALWEVLDRLGLPSGTLGWPSSYPPDPGLAFSFSDRYFEAEPPGLRTAASPAGLAERGELFRVAADDLDPAESRRLGADLDPAVGTALAGDLWRESLAAFLVDQVSELQALFVWLPGLDEVSRRYFGAYAALHLGGERPGPPGQASQVVPRYYEHLDEFLERLSQRSPGPLILAVVSAHGIEEQPAWKRLWDLFEGRRALEGSTRNGPDGVFLLTGPGVRRGNLLSGAALVDVAPTLLYALGFPVARDLDGRVLTDAFEAPFLAVHPLTYVPSYEALAPSEGGPPVGLDGIDPQS